MRYGPPTRRIVRYGQVSYQSGWKRRFYVRAKPSRRYRPSRVATRPWMSKRTCLTTFDCQRFQKLRYPAASGVNDSKTFSEGRRFRQIQTPCHSRDLTANPTGEECHGNKWLAGVEPREGVERAGVVGNSCFTAAKRQFSVGSALQW